MGLALFYLIVMITAASKYLERINYIEANLENEFSQIVVEVEPEILEYLREKQLFEKGIDSEGVRLEPYSPYTIALKKIKGEPYNRTTLLDTEAFYKSMYVTARGDKYYIFASDEKAPALIAKYGKNILALTQENNEEINDREFYPRLLKFVVDTLWGRL